MKSLIHEIVTKIKFIYPSIAYEESSTDNELIVVAETYMQRIYPIQMSVAGMKFVGEDYWGRPTFRDESEQFYCELDGRLYFKGNDPDGEPHYPVNKEIVQTFPEIDEEMTEFKPHLDKVKSYFAEHEKVELVNVSITIQENKDDFSQSKIICNYHLRLK